jgi:hypothetical protein
MRLFKREWLHALFCANIRARGIRARGALLPSCGRSVACVARQALCRRCSITQLGGGQCGECRLARSSCEQSNLNAVLSDRAGCFLALCTALPWLRTLPGPGVAGAHESAGAVLPKLARLRVGGNLKMVPIAETGDAARGRPRCPGPRPLPRLARRWPSRRQQARLSALSRTVTAGSVHSSTPCSGLVSGAC